MAGRDDDAHRPDFSRARALAGGVCFALAAWQVVWTDLDHSTSDPLTLGLLLGAGLVLLGVEAGRRLLL